MTEKQIYSKCGFYCNRCPAFRENSSTEAGRQHGSALWEKYFGLHIKPENIRCEGCQAAEPWKTGNMLPDRMCHIRSCAIHNGVLTCAHCSFFPCEEYSRHVPGAGLRKQREDAAHIKITDSEYAEYLEQFEGQTHLKVLHSSLQPREITPPKPFPAGGKIVPFPQKTGLKPAEREKMMALHSLLQAIFSARAGCYAAQSVLERKKLYNRGLIWVMGLYGEIRDGKLMLESERCQYKKECIRLVRKTTNTLQGAIEDAVKALSSYGLRIEFTPSKKSWVLTLEVDPDAGGPAIISSLKTWVSALVREYGAPVYAGSFDLKGKAFKLFTRVDMRGL